MQTMGSLKTTRFNNISWSYDDGDKQNASTTI